MRGSWSWWILMVSTAAATLLGFELHLRRSASHVVDHGGFIYSNSEQLIENTPRGRRLVPNADVVIRNHYISHRDVPVHISSQGFHDTEVPSRKPTGEWRILVLGDSITSADYLALEAGFVKRAEADLRSTGTLGPLRVINAGVVDVGLREEVDILEERGLAVNPDTVVVAFYLNDSRPPWGFDAEAGHRGWLRQHSLLADRIAENLRLRHWIHEKGGHRFQWVAASKHLDWAGDPAGLRELASLARYDWGAAWDPQSWPAIDRELRRLRALSGAHGFSVAVVAFPVSFQVEARFLDDAPQQSIRRLAEELGFSFLDLLPALRAARAQGPLFFDHCHPNERGNDLIGRLLAGFLAERMRPPAGHMKSAAFTTLK